MLVKAPFYAANFSERFFIMEDANALRACVADLGAYPLSAWLKPALEAPAETSKSVSLHRPGHRFDHNGFSSQLFGQM